MKSRNIDKKKESIMIDLVILNVFLMGIMSVVYGAINEDTSAKLIACVCILTSMLYFMLPV
jgi:hypothetical protein